MSLEVSRVRVSNNELRQKSKKEKNSWKYQTSYWLIERDPMMDQVLTMIRKAKLTFTQVERKSGVSAQTIRAWSSGKTRRPKRLTLEYAARAVGFRMTFIRIVQGGRN